MKNGTAHHIGQHSAARRRKAATPAPKHGRLLSGNGKDEGCGTAAKRQEAVCAAGHAANGFLRYSFLPKLSGGFQDGIGQGAEEGFYNSLALLCSHYSLVPPNITALDFPYSAALALHDLQSQLADRQYKASLALVQDASGGIALSASEQFDTSYSLYYIPVIPMYFLGRRCKPAFDLLLCACAYLYHIAGMPYYRQEGSYLYDQYRYIGQWVEEEADDYREDYNQNSSEIRAAAIIGDIMERRISNTCHLQQYALRLEKFCIRNSLDKACYDIASEFFSLWNAYPEHNLKTHMPCGTGDNDYDDDDDYYNAGTIGMFQYISFSAGTSGRLYETLAENINNEFNEYDDIEEPTVIRVFNGVQDTGDTLDYEVRLFAAIDRLCYLLNE